MLGAIIGDIAGSVYEFNNIKTKTFEPFYHPKAKFTDDTVCTVAIADALMNQKNPTDTLVAWCTKYWTNGGWGKRFAKWLASSNHQPYGSIGNGSAMRVSSAAWLANSYEEAMTIAEQVTIITHDHPEGIKGALATTAAIYWFREGKSHIDVWKGIQDQFGYDLSRSVEEIRAHNPHSEECAKTVPEAITCALAATNFEDAIRNAISIGGDSDTIGAITGSIAEARFGIPADLMEQAKYFLTDDIAEVVEQFYSNL